MKKAILKNSLKSYLVIFLCGIFVGTATRFTDFFREDTLWSFSSVATLYGFWILSVAVIVLLSSSNLCAGISSFLYMFGMTLSFYGVQYLLGFWLPAFDNGGFKTKLFLLYTYLSAACGVGAFMLYFWERWERLGAVLYALPVGALLAETAGVGVYLVKNGSYLFQLLLDALAAVVLGVLFYKRSARKTIYFFSVVIVAAAVYFLIYRPFL